MITNEARAELQQLLAEKSVLLGEFTLKSGAKSNFYFDGRQTALHPRGARLIGEVVHGFIREQEAKADLTINAVGGLTMGADPISVAVAIRSDLAGDVTPLNALVIRKEPKDHGAGKQVEGPFEEGDVVAVVDDTITTAGSTLTAIEAIEREGGKVAFVICLVDREEGGRENLEARGYHFFPVFVKSEFL